MVNYKKYSGSGNLKDYCDITSDREHRRKSYFMERRNEF